MSDWSAPLWCHLPNLSDERYQGIVEALSNNQIGSEYSFMAERVRHVLAVLNEFNSGTWCAELTLLPWPSETGLSIEEERGRPPYQYVVKLDLSKDGVVANTLYLSAIELRLVTEFNPDLGRRIGDELDGPRPT